MLSLVLTTWSDANRELVFRFFVNFSMFECALKRAGFLQHPRNKEGYAAPDWKKFADSLGGCFAGVHDGPFGQAVALLKASPPQQQVVKQGQLGWASQPQLASESAEAYLLRLVKTVRNNLFHGGKYPAVAVEEAARNRDLLEACLVVLEKCRQLSPQLETWFAEAA
jgi:hypothetical protein